MKGFTNTAYGSPF